MIHAYKLNGYNIILDQNSGCVHSVDPVAYDMITMYQDHDKEEIRRFILEKYKDQPDVTNADVDLCFKDIEALIADGRLFAEDTFEAVADQFKRRQGVLKAICLHVAHDCNLACKYCFAGKGEYDGQREIMSYEVGKQALDYLIANSPGRRNLEVDFFGGEPLLNWDVCKRLVAYGREQEKLHNKNFRFTLTTNGLLINDDVIDFSNREMGNVVLSLDGRKVTHDRLRVGRNGKGSYDLILDKFKRFADSRGQKDYYMRGTYTHFNTDFAADVLHMADLGFKELSIEPGTEYMAVTPTGDLYPCHQFVGDTDFLLGNVYDGVTRPQVLEQFEHCNVYSHKECKDCFAKLYCSGGCAANAYHTTGSVNGVYDFGCQLHRKRIECAIMLKVAEAEEGLKVEY